mmetsp:Transcript_20936/g.22386  ORF Transcript_20936/g.22386 Transcript_20936/m.22386 type:complete len:503 (+) Transcript_20936:191-1699(+)
MGERKISRVGTTASLKARTKPQEDHILLARGLSARLTGANTPLAPLLQEEIERDLRHMEAFSNACTSYAQQYYIFTNQNNKISKENSNSNEQHSNVQSASGSQARAGSAGGSYRGHQMPIIAMPVRIDPEEEKRLQTLRQKIQQCEAQREIYEGQYLSLRAHYISLSKKLKVKNEDVNSRISFLQEQVQKRGKLLALQRVRLQIARETLECLRYRGSHSSPSSETKEHQADLHAIWNDLDKQWKKADESIVKSGGTSSSSSGVCHWPASRIPKIPPGVPLLVSQLGQQPGHAVAWSTSGAFGAKPDSLVWIQNQVPTKRPDTSNHLLPALREDAPRLESEIETERKLNREFQTKAIERRKRNDELVSMMTLLRSETEAVVARHNILLESDEAKQAAMVLYEEEAMVTKEVNAALNNSNSDEVKIGVAVGSMRDNGIVSGVVNDKESRGKPLAEISGLKEDDENDGYEAEEEEDEGEILEGEVAGKRPLDGDIDSSRSKRRRL